MYCAENFAFSTNIEPNLNLGIHNNDIICKNDFDLLCLIDR
jgi:hypothetical protein